MASLKRACLGDYLAYWGEMTGSYLLVDGGLPGTAPYWFILGNTQQLPSEEGGSLVCTYEELNFPPQAMQQTQESIERTGACG